MWNHRLIKKDEIYYVSEVWYDDKGDIVGFTEPIISWDSREEILEELEMMKDDINGTPILDEWEILKNLKKIDLWNYKF